MAVDTKSWTRDELLVTLNLYHKLPFGKFHARNPAIIALAEKLGRGANSVVVKLHNFASLDPSLQLRGIRGLQGASAKDRAVWAEFHNCAQCSNSAHSPENQTRRKKNAPLIKRAINPNAKQCLSRDLLPDRFSRLVARLQTLYGSDLTIGGFRNITEEQFASRQCVGVKYVSLFRDLQAYLENLPFRKAVESHEESTDPPALPTDLAHKYRLHYSRLEKAEKELITKFVRRGMEMDDVTPAFLMEWYPAIIKKTKGFGKCSARTLRSIQKRITDAITHNNGAESILIPDDYGVDLSLSDTGDSLLQDIEQYLDTLEDEQKMILTKRIGFRTELLTLQNLATQCGVTRERIRQKEEALLFNLKRSIHVSSRILAKKLLNVSICECLSQLGMLRDAFATETCLLRTLERLAGFDEGHLTEQTTEHVRNNLLDEFFISTVTPSIEEALTYIQEELNMERGAAEYALHKLRDDGFVELTETHIYPRKAKKEVAVVFVLATHPDGLQWKKIAEKVNEMGISRARFSEERMEYVLYNSEMIFKSGPKQFSHVRYLGVTREQIRQWISDVKSTICRSGHKALNLRTEYYAVLSEPKPDYYLLRHVVRTYGAVDDLCYNGKSGKSMVSVRKDSEKIEKDRKKIGTGRLR